MAKFEDIYSVIAREIELLGLNYAGSNQAQGISEYVYYFLQFQQAYAWTFLLNLFVFFSKSFVEIPL